MKPEETIKMDIPCTFRPLMFAIAAHDNVVSAKDLSSYLSLPVETVRNQIKRAKAEGWLKVVGKTSGTYGTSIFEITA